jgi:hypothetical protein
MPMSSVHRLLFPPLDAVWDRHNSALTPNMYRARPVQVRYTATLDSISSRRRVKNTRATVCAKVAVERPTGIGGTCISTEGRKMGGKLEAGKDGRGAKGRGGLFAAFEAVTDVYLERFGERREEADTPALAGSLHGEESPLISMLCHNLTDGNFHSCRRADTRGVSRDTLDGPDGRRWRKHLSASSILSTFTTRSAVRARSS